MARTRDNVVLEVDLDGKTLRISDRDMPLSTGFHEGRARIESLILDQQFSDFLRNVPVKSSMTAEILNGDGGLNSDLANYNWHNRPIRAKVGQDEDVSQYTTPFEGIIRFPEGIKHNDERVIITADDIRHKDDEKIPPTKFTESSFPNADPGIYGKPRPIVYGEFLNPLRLPLYRTNKDTNLFRMAGHAMYSIGSLFYEDYRRNLEYDVQTYTDGKDKTNARIQTGINKKFHKNLDLGTKEIMDGCQFGQYFYVVSKESGNGYLHKFDPASGWSQVHSWSGYYPICICVAIGKLYVGCSNGRIYHRDTGDTDWSEDQYHGGTPDTAVRSLAPFGTTGLFACTFKTPFSGELYARDSEDTWHVVSGYTGNDPSERTMVYCLGYLYIGRPSAFEVIKTSDETLVGTRAGGCYAVAARAKGETDDSADEPAYIYFSVTGALLKTDHGADPNTAAKVIGDFDNPITDIIMDEDGAYLNAGAELYEDKEYRGDFTLIDTLSDVVRWLAFYDYSTYDSNDEAIYTLAGTINTSFVYALSQISSISNLSVEGFGLVQDEPTYVIDDILQDYMGVSAGNIDSASFTQAKTDIGTIKVHRCVTSLIDALALIGELCAETGLLLSIRDNKYYLQYLWRINKYGPHHDDIDTSGFDTGDNQSYLNELTIQYKHDPSTSDFHGTTTKENATAKSDDKVTIAEDLEFYWRYNDSDYVTVATYAQDLVDFFSANPPRVEVTLHDELGTNLGSTVRLTKGHLTDTPLVARQVKKDLARGQDGVIAWDISGLDTIQYPDTFYEMPGDEVFIPGGFGIEPIETFPVVTHGNVIKGSIKMKDTYFRLKVEGAGLSQPLYSEEVSAGGSEEQKTMYVNISTVAEDSYLDVILEGRKALGGSDPYGKKLALTVGE